MLWDLEILGRNNWERTQLTSIVKGPLNRPYKVWLMPWIYKTFRLCLIVIEHSVVAWLQVPNQCDPRLNPMVSRFSISILSNLCSESGGAQNFEILVEHSDTGGLSSIPLGWNIHLLFNFGIVNFVWKTNEGEAESIVLLIFVLWWHFNCWWVSSCGLGQKVLFKAIWNHIFYQPGFKPKQ